MIINTKNMHLLKKRKGFTLIELMIVVAIIGIIAAIGYPSYTSYLKKAGRSEASALLLEVMEKQEQWYRQNLSYTADLAELGYPATLETDSARHIINEMKACDGSTLRRCVIVTASAQGKQAGDVALTLNSKGAKTNWE